MAPPRAPHDGALAPERAVVLPRCPPQRWDGLAERAVEVLARNDRGTFTRPSPQLYPHQWSWDSAITAVGLAHVDVDRAAVELRSLLAAQWSDGMVPHVAFDPAVPPEAYFPGPSVWRAERTGRAPAARATSGICQPPVHAVALSRLWEAAVASGAEERIRPVVAELWPRVARWHDYLRRARDREGSGLVAIWHPWESGADNSPRWDPVLARLRPGALDAYRRHDLALVSDASQRPTGDEYDRYLWLVQLLRDHGYDPEVAAEEHPFQVKDVFFSALLAVSDDALVALADVVGADRAVVRELEAGAAATRAAVDAAFDPATGLCHDLDVVTGCRLPARTFAGLAPLVAGGCAHEADAAAALDSPAFCGADGLVSPLPPSTAVDDPAFHPRSYWRGPNWPVVNWLLWDALRRTGRHGRAEALRMAALDQLAEVVDTVPFAEYVEPRTGEGLGSPSQSWSAAVCLDWLHAG